MLARHFAIGWFLCLASVSGVFVAGIGLAADRPPGKSPLGSTAQERAFSQHPGHSQNPAFPGTVRRGHGTLVTPWPSGPICQSRVYAVVVPGLVPGYVYYREEICMPPYCGVPIGCCPYYLGGYRYYYWYGPSVVYFDPAAPVLRDLAAVTNRYIGDSRGRVEQGGVTPQSGGETSQQQDSGQQGIERTMPSPSVADPIKLRPSNQQQRDLASRFIGFGDRCFLEGQYRDAYFKYKEAEKAAPDLVDSLFRQGFALIATKQYQLAFHAFRRGLRMDPAWPKKLFSLSRLYEERQLDLKEHLAALAEENEKAKPDPILSFLLGVMLFRCDRVDDAKGFFEIARSSPSTAELAALFLDNKE
ncbi:MAG: hypothetical protein ACUVQH_06805 [Thermogutta sp.]